MTLSLFAAATAATAFEMLQPRPKRIEPAGGFCRDAANVLVVTARVEGVRADLAPEAYELVVAPDGVTIRASDARGERYARTTLAQLVKLADGKAPCGAVADWPQHRWRGLMHDCGRNYLDVASIKKTLDLMAAYKYNLFHWHLTDYYGWRLESKAHPELQAPRAFRRQPMKYYTQAEFRDVLDYAAARGITVMPEMDVPGHSLALRRGLGVETMAEPRVKEAVCELIDELCSLATPEEMPFVHIGTDEARTPPEQVPDSFCPAWAARVRANGRIPVGWSPGKDITTPAGVKSAKMVWRDGFAPADDEAAFDATRLYFGSADCLALLNTAVFSKPFRFAADERRALGPVACSWHDDMLGDDTSAALRNNFFAPAIVMLSSLMWERREKDRPEFLLRLPPPGTDAFDDARRFEARIAAQRDKALAGLDMPFAFVRQTDMRWRVSDAADGRVVADDVPQGTVYVRPWSRPGQEPPDALLPCRTGCAILETWIKSATNRTVGAWIGFTHFKRSGGRNRGLPEDGEWDAVSKGITVELNDRVVPPPKWGRPGLRYIAPDLDEPTSNNIAELPFTNEEYWMREPTSLALRAGWNHVKITLPHAAEKYGYHWVSTFIPLEGTSDHPREAQGLEYASSIVSLKPGETEVVVADDAPKSVLFAVEELTNFLSRAWGRDVPVRRRPTGARAIYLGDSAWTRQAGIDVSSLARDAFAIVADRGWGVFIAGRDDPKEYTHKAVYSPRTGVWALLHEHATLYGVYEFLERFAGVRMYFPGELGEIVPRAGAIELPAGRLDVAPDFSVRNYSWPSDGDYFEGEDRAGRLLPARKLNYVRNRMQTLYIPCCHGSNGFHIQRRFAAEHPEYMALFPKGKRLVRDVDPDETAHHPGQLCHSSAVYDELFKDICSYARGDGPEVRGLGDRWPVMTFRRPWVDVMPQDGYVECRCDKCQAAYDKGEQHYATDLIWGRTVELANRLRKAGVDMRITQMAYTPYRRIPAFDIPDNVDVMVAEGGPWSAPNPAALAREQDEIRRWSEKLGHPVWIWTYPNKYGQMAIPDVPNGTPRAWARYYKDVAPWIFGAYAECENDRFLYNALCYFVFGKVCWNVGADVDALLDEYFSLMFGPAAGPMAALADDIERLWLGKVAGNLVDTGLGPLRQPPSEYALFAQIYAPETIRRWRAWFDEAAARVEAGGLEARRVALFRREFLDPLARAGDRYLKSISVADELARRAQANRANLLVNGDLSAPSAGGSRRHFGFYDDPAHGRGWRGGWITDAQTAENVRVAAEPSAPGGKVLRITSTDEARTVRVENHAPADPHRFSPGRRYRISFFVRLGDVVSHGKGGGVGAKVWHDRNEWFPKNRMTGTTDWIHQEYFFTAGPKSADFYSQFMVHLWNATGTVEFADLRVEPLD